MTEITPAELADRIADGDDTLLTLDIRKPEDFESWQIPGSINVPVIDQLTSDTEAIGEAFAHLPEDREIVTVCQAGGAAAVATEKLRDRGFDAKTLTGGLNAWSRVHLHAELDVGIDGTVVQVARPGKGCLSHILISHGSAGIFDPSQHVDVYENILDEYNAELVATFDTHAHADHLSGGATLATRHTASYHLHPADNHGHEAVPLSDGKSIDIGTVTVDVLHTPGHSPGSVSFSIEDALILTGDTLFHDGVGRVELGIGAGLEQSTITENAQQLYEGIHRIRARPDDALVVPAHDAGSPIPPIAQTVEQLSHTNEDLHRDRSAFIESFETNPPAQPENFERIKRINMGIDDGTNTDGSQLEIGPNRCAAR